MKNLNKFVAHQNKTLIHKESKSSLYKSIYNQLKDKFSSPTRIITTVEVTNKGVVFSNVEI